MIQYFLMFEKWLADLYGYRFLVFFEDTIVLFAGIFIGMIIMAFLSGWVVFKVTKVKDIGSTKVKLVRFKHEGVKEYIAAPKNIGESVETLLLVIFRPLFSYREYTYRDERRTKIFLVLLISIGLIVLILAIVCTFTLVLDGN